MAGKKGICREASPSLPYLLGERILAVWNTGLEPVVVPTSILTSLNYTVPPTASHGRDLLPRLCPGKVNTLMEA